MAPDQGLCPWTPRGHNPQSTTIGSCSMLGTTWVYSLPAPQTVPHPYLTNITDVKHGSSLL